MNCANHSELAAVAFCRTCGKPLCQSCTRDVRGVIYCESCLAAKLEGTMPAAGFVPAQTPYQQGAYQQVVPPAGGMPAAGMRAPLGSGPNPAVAGILAGFFPIGVGAVYCSQYAKGLAYLVIMVLLGYGTDHAGGLGGLFVAAFLFFWVFQIIDAVRTAKAIQTGEPIPDPLGIGQAFGGSVGADKIDVAKIPVGAVILIGLGVLFLLHTMGMWEFGFDRFWPLIIVALGGFMFYRQWERPTRLCHCSRCRFRGIMGPALVLTTGILLLLHSTDVADMGRTWPAWILVVGVIKLMQSTASSEGHVGPLPPGPGSYPPPSAPVAPAPAAPPQDNQQPPSSGEVNHV
jgi:Domain of unknown function (DUF5668)/B-box zinc finger